MLIVNAPRYVPLQHSRNTQTVQLERSLQVVDLPGIIFEDHAGIQGQKVLSVLLHNVVKPKDVNDPIYVGGRASSPCSFPISSQKCHQSRRSLHELEPKY